MRNTFKFILVLLLGIAMLSGGLPAAESAEKPVFMLCISHMTNAFTLEVAEAMKAAAEELGAELIINEGGNDINRQVGQIESGINQQVNAIIVEPVSVNGVIPAIEAAMKANIPVIVFNQNISDPSKATCFVGVSNEQLGETQMTRAVSDLGGKGNIAIFLGPRGSEAPLGRSKGYKNVLDKYPDVKIVFEDDASWTTESALKLAENWLQTGIEINAFVSQNDNMALGGVKALEDKNLLGKVKCYGLDAVPDALRAVKEGRLTLTVSQETSLQSREAVQAAMALFKGGVVKKEVLVNSKIIDSSNVDEYLAK
jgi:ribose transport system substrate-binding protein/inositol transport system substrate-binding protein